MDFLSEGLIIGGHFVHLREESDRARDPRLMTIDMLPDDVLLEIFGYFEYVDDPLWFAEQDTWRLLVHVCRRWRHLVFASPRHLNLRLPYRGYRPMSELLDIWPVLPVSLMSIIDHSYQRRGNTVAALESVQSDRICEINIEVIATSHWERFAAAMEKPFPELTHLELWTCDEVQVLPDSFLGGFSPRLRTIELTRIPLPSIPRLLLSANSLVELALWDIPDSGYISPDAMASALAVLTRLESLDLHFLSSRSRPDPQSQPLPPPTRLILPALTELVFTGVYGYLEVLLARSDLPLLYCLDIAFFTDLDFDAPQLHWLIGHAGQFKTFDHAIVWVYNYSIRLVLSTIGVEVDVRQLDLQIICRELDAQLSSLSQVCSSSFPLISTLEELQIREDKSLSSSHWKDDMENARWLELLRPFTALKNLYLTDGVARRLCGALQELSGERTTEVLPALRSLFVEGSSLERVQEAIESFITIRQLSGRPVVVNRWKD